MSSPKHQDEETPLLQRDNAPRKPTPLPKAQMFLLLLIRLAEPITSHSISPYMSEVGFIFYLLRRFNANHCPFYLARQQSLRRWWRQANDWILHRDDSASYLQLHGCEHPPVELCIL